MKKNCNIMKHIGLEFSKCYFTGFWRVRNLKKLIYWHHIAWWLVSCIILTVCRGPRYMVYYYSGCVCGGCLWMRLTFESVGWVSRLSSTLWVVTIQSVQGLNKQKGRVRENSFSLPYDHEAGTLIISSLQTCTRTGTYTTGSPCLLTCYWVCFSREPILIQPEYRNGSFLFDILLNHI